jgi:hypothetical protein
MMKKNPLKSSIVKLFLNVAVLSIFFYSCKEVDQVLNNPDTQKQSSNAEGLKEALRVGADTAVSKLNVKDGYFKDAAIKLLLPEQVQQAIAAFKAKEIKSLGLTITGEQLYTTGLPGLIKPLSAKEDSLVLGINRAAEDAALEAKPLFVNAITGMSFSDATSILFGADTAATNFLRVNTFSPLVDKFEPMIDASLKKIQVGNKSVSTSYENFVADYNAILNTSIPQLTGGSKTVASLMGIKTILVTDLSSHTTNKALNGLFLKVADQEYLIRKNPLARVTSILKDVFGQLDKK